MNEANHRNDKRSKKYAHIDKTLKSGKQLKIVSRDLSAQQELKKRQTIEN